MDMDLLKVFKGLLARKKELDADVEEVKREIAELQPQVLDMFAREGIQHIKIDGKILYLRKQLWAGLQDGVTREDAIQSLKQHGLDDYVSESYNLIQVSAHFRELARESDDYVLPEGFKVTEKFTISLRG